MTERVERGEGTKDVRRPIRVAIRDEDLEDVKAHGARFNDPMTEDTEGQIYILHVPKPGDQSDDAQGHGGRYYGLRPAETDEVERQSVTSGQLVLDESDPIGQSWRLEFQDAAGQQVRRGLGQTEDDVEGQGSPTRSLRSTSRLKVHAPSGTPKPNKPRPEPLPMKPFAR